MRLDHFRHKNARQLERCRKLFGVLTTPMGHVVLKSIKAVNPWLSNSLDHCEEGRRNGTDLVSDINQSVSGASATPSKRDVDGDDTVAEVTTIPTQRGTEPATDLFFGWLPYEIRYKIQLLVFAGPTIHVDIKFGLNKHLNGRHPHPQRAPIDLTYNSMLFRTRDWFWHGVVCHNSYPPKSGERSLSRGRKRRSPIEWHYRDSSHPCLDGRIKYRIGISGWLRACRQAFFEATTILYTKNTISISSPDLISRLPNVMSPSITSSLTSLELVWDSRIVPLNLDFASRTTPPRSGLLTEPPIFPALAHLRLCLDYSKDYSWQSISSVLERQPPPLNQARAAELPPLMDSIIQTIAPPTAEIYVSYDNKQWYMALNMTLIKEQGVEATQPQNCQEWGGFKCWRRISASSPSSILAGKEIAECSSDRESQDQAAQVDRGYWFHFPGSVVHTTVFDWQNHAH